MKQKFFSVDTWLKRFGYAFKGIKYAFRNEQSVGIHFVATILIITLSIIKSIKSTEAIALSLTVGIVWVAELLNTAIEKLADKVSPDFDIQIKYVKDISAAAVLMASLTALVVGLIIFIPKFL